MRARFLSAAVLVPQIMNAQSKPIVIHADRVLDGRGHVMQGASVGQNWAVQLTGRFTGDDFKLGSWLMNIPRALAYFLPWTLLLPLIAKAKWITNSDRYLARALSWGTAVPFLAVNLLPGALPRYSMPALIPACWLMAMTLSAPERSSVRISASVSAARVVDMAPGRRPSGSFEPPLAKLPRVLRIERHA